MAKKETKKGLGKGLGALFGGDVAVSDLTRPAATSNAAATEADQTPLVMLDVNQLKANPWQPRKAFDDDAHSDLTESIRAKGVLSPLLAVEKDGEYILVAGERRLRAAKSAGLKEVPVLLRALDEDEMAQIALIENVQRTDLSVIEEAAGSAALIDEYGYTQQQLATLMGKSRPYIANLLRLLDLPEPVMEALQAGQISAGHARALLAIKAPDLAAELCNDVIAQDLSVRALEAMIQDIQSFDLALDEKTSPKKKKSQTKQYKAVCDQLSEKLQTKVAVTGNAKRRRLVIDFYGDEDLTRILDVLGIECY